MAPVDVLILTAVQDELDAVLLACPGWAELRDSSGFRYFQRSFSSAHGSTFNVAAAWIGEMGAASAAIRGGQLLAELDPSLLAMCGICAGFRDKVSLGDVIVADQLWPYDEGKRLENEFSHAVRTFDLQATWKMDASLLARELDLDALTRERPPTKAAQRRWLLRTLHAHEFENGPPPRQHVDRKRACPGWTERLQEALAERLVVREGPALRLSDAGRDWIAEDELLFPDSEREKVGIRVHVGAIASGSAVVEDPRIFERLRRIVCSTIGLEMEGWAIGELARRFEKKAILVKAVQDFADHEKDDAFRKFACRASAEVLLAFLGKNIEPQRQTLAEVAPRRDRERERDFEMDREDPFLARVERVVRLRHAGANLSRHRAPAPFAGVLEVAVDVGGFFDVRIVAALDGPITEALAARFAAEVEPPFRARHSMLRTTLVHRGEVAPKELRERMHRRGVLLETFDQYQGLFDLTAYLDWQTRELERSTVYAPGIYVEQHATIEIAGNLERSRTEDILRSLWDLLLTPSQRRFVLVLGEFGAGKTFLLRELCRRMGRDKHPVWPVLLEMSKLEKQHDLAELLGAHFGRADVPGYNFRAFQYMLEEGRIALFFDGFDELADRVTYDNSTAHFDTVLSAAQGQAKVLLSSRRQHFLTDGDADRAVRRELAKKAEGVAGAGYRLVMIEPFQEEQIRRYLGNVLGDAEAAEARYRLIDEVKDLLGLSHNPRMLAFIAGIPEASLREAKKEQGEISAAGLYELLVKHWLDFEHQRSRRLGSSKGISRAALEKGIEALGVSMWHERARSVDVERIREVLQRAGGMLGEHSLDPEVLTHMFASGSLLVRDSEAQFSFVHRSVMEWLVARVSAEELKRGEEPAALAVDEMSALMGDFFASMAGAEKTTAWVWTKMLEEGIVQKNAALLLLRMGERFEQVSFEGQDLRGRDFSGVDWRGANLQRADLRGVMLKGANLRGAKLGGALLARADLSQASLARAELSQADFSFARLEGVDFSLAMPIEPMRFRGANLLAAEGIADEHHAALLAVGAAPPVLRSVAPMWAAGSSCRSVAWSPDGELLAAGRDDGTVLLVDTVAGEVLHVLSGHSGGVESVAFSPDGKALASGGYDIIVRLWDVCTGQTIRTFEGHQMRVLSVAFSPNGKVLASSSDDITVRLWDVGTGRTLRTFKGHQRRLLCIAFSPNGKALASGSTDSTVRLWDVGTGRTLRTFEGHHEWVSSVAFSADGRALASGSTDSTARLWDVGTGRTLRTFEGHQGSAWSVAFSPDGKALASGSSDHTVRLWDVGTGRVLRAFEGHRDSAWSVAFSPDGKALASGSLDHTVRLWDVATGRALRSFERYWDAVQRVTWNQLDGSIVANYFNGTIRHWHAATGHVLHVEHKKKIFEKLDERPATSSNGDFLATASPDGSIHVSTPTGQLIVKLLATPDGWVAFTPDGRYKYGGNITGSFWHVSGLCRFEPGELDLLLPDDADFRHLPPPPAQIQPCPPITTTTTKPPAP